MALFNFLKKKEEIEKNAEKARAGLTTEKPSAKEASQAKAKKGAVIPSAPIAVLVAPHITEKSTAFAVDGTYVFRVEKNATGVLVKDAIQKTYNVHVVDVRLVALPAKRRRRGLTRAHTSGYKKAIVVLKKGDRIDLF